MLNKTWETIKAKPEASALV